MSAKRTASGAHKPSKRARRDVDASEVTFVQSLSDEHRLDLDDADVFYVPDFVSEDLALAWYDKLLEIDGWYQPTLKMYGRDITQSRSIAAFATDRELHVKYSGQVVSMQYDYPDVLKEIQDKVEEKLGVKFNHVMLNKYENGTVYIGNHRDNLENRVIASLSLGAERTFVLKHDQCPPLPKRPVKGQTTLDGSASSSSSSSSAGTSETSRKHRRFKLANGSLVVMQGEMQKHWKHEIPKEPKVKQGRISLTFRQLVF